MVAGRADHAAVQIADAADDDHDQQGAGLRPLQQVGAGQAGQVGEQCPGQAGNRATQREGDQAVAEDRVAERFHARFVFADGLQRAPEAGFGQAAEEQHGEGQQSGCGIEQRRVVGQAEAGQGHSPIERQAVVTAPAAGRDEQVIRHLGEGQGDHDEIDATRAQADGADDQREQPGDAHGGGKDEQRLVDAGLLANGRGIGAGTEEGRVAERHHAAEAKDEIEAGSGQRKDQHGDIGRRPVPVGTGGAGRGRRRGGGEFVVRHVPASCWRMGPRGIGSFPNRSGHLQARPGLGEASGPGLVEPVYFYS